MCYFWDINQSVFWLTTDETRPKTTKSNKTRVKLILAITAVADLEG